MNSSVEGCVICIHEDRATHWVGVKLAVLSLLNHCPELPIIISCPTPPASLVRWLENLTAKVTLVSYPELQDWGWNVKPALLLRLLEACYSEVIWMDSDIIVNGKVLSNLPDYSTNTLIVTQETYWGQQQGGHFRTYAWGLTPGRNLLCTLNTGILRVTTHHIPLLEAWQIMLNHPLYVHTQALPWYKRPLHMIGDQEVLTALMGSSEFSSIPIVMLRRGVDIAQCFGSSGFTPAERLSNLTKGLPPLIHAMGGKPWMKSPCPPALWQVEKTFLQTLREYYDYLALELSPYVSVAQPYREMLEEETDWMEIHSILARLLSLLAIGNPVLCGFPSSLLESVGRRLRRHLKIARYSVSPEFCLQESPLKPVAAD